MAHLQGMKSKDKRERVLHLAQQEGLKAGGLVGFLSTAGVAAATYLSPRFRKATTVSSKTALAISPFFLIYFLRTELVMHGANQDPQAYGLVEDPVADASRKAKPAAELNVAKKLANWCYVNPFKTVVIAGIPAVGGILYTQRKETNLKLSQKLIHTRVYGQMTIVSMMVATMMFQELMKRNGGLFVAAGAEEEEGGEGNQG